MIPEKKIQPYKKTGTEMTNKHNINSKHNKDKEYSQILLRLNGGGDLSLISEFLEVHYYRWSELQKIKIIVVVNKGNNKYS